MFFGSILFIKQDKYSTTIYRGTGVKQVHINEETNNLLSLFSTMYIFLAYHSKQKMIIKSLHCLEIPRTECNVMIFAVNKTYIEFNRLMYALNQFSHDNIKRNFCLDFMY